MLIGLLVMIDYNSDGESKKKIHRERVSAEIGVSKRTILRDLQELSLMGVLLYSEVGPHGGYQVLNKRILPPIAFRALS